MLFTTLDTKCDRETYKTHTTPPDPISKALECIYICQMQAKIYIEYQGHFRKVQLTLEQFLGERTSSYFIFLVYCVPVNLLDTCEKIDDARTLLEWGTADHQGVTQRVTQRVTHFTKYPRIEDALSYGLENFIGHDFCQQILGEEWVSSRETSSSIVKHTYNILDFIISGISSLIFLPLHILGCIYFKLKKLCKKENLSSQSCHKVVKEHVFYLAYPRNRYVTNTLMFFLYIIAIFVQGYISPSFLLIDKKENATSYVLLNEVAEKKRRQKHDQENNN